MQPCAPKSAPWALKFAAWALKFTLWAPKFAPWAPKFAPWAPKFASRAFKFAPSAFKFAAWAPRRASGPFLNFQMLSWKFSGSVENLQVVPKNAKLRFKKLPNPRFWGWNPSREITRWIRGPTFAEGLSHTYVREVLNAHLGVLPTPMSWHVEMW